MVLGEKGKKRDVKLLNIDEGEQFKCQMGTHVVVDGTLGDDDLYDIFYVPGGVGSGAMTSNAKMTRVIKRRERQSHRFQLLRRCDPSRRASLETPQ